MDKDNRNKSDKASAEINLIYQLLADAVKSAKNQIWLTMYYVLLVDAAIVTFYSLLEDKKLQWFLVVISGIATIAGVSLIAHYNDWLKENRQKIDLKIKPKLSDEAQDALDISITNGWTTYDRVFFAGSCIFFLFGFALVAWYLLFDKA
jgi:hypothetical protein